MFEFWFDFVLYGILFTKKKKKKTNLYTVSKVKEFYCKFYTLRFMVETGI